MTLDRKELESLFNVHGVADFKWIDPKDVVVSQWVRIKCMFGCPDYGKNAACPPNVPSVSECERFFKEYATGAICHFQRQFDRPEDRHPWTRAVNRELIKLERAVLLVGYQKAFLLLMDTCSFCPDCVATREDCKNPKLGRPTPEALAVDVYTTARHYGYPIEFLSDYSQTMNRYAFLLIE